MFSNISDSLSPSCITRVKTVQWERGAKCVQEEYKDFAKGLAMSCTLLQLQLLYDVSGSFLQVVRTTSCAEELPSGCQQTGTLLNVLTGRF